MKSILIILSLMIGFTFRNRKAYYVERNGKLYQVDKDSYEKEKKRLTEKTKKEMEYSRKSKTGETNLIKKLFKESLSLTIMLQAFIRARVYINISFIRMYYLKENPTSSLPIGSFFFIIFLRAFEFYIYVV